MALSKARLRQIKFNNFCCSTGSNIRQTPIWPKPEKQQSQEQKK